MNSQVGGGAATGMNGLRHILLVANLVRAKLCEKSRKMTETLANWYSSDRDQQELSNEYQQDRVWMDFKHLSDFISCVKIAAALKGLSVFFQVAQLHLQKLP